MPGEPHPALARPTPDGELGASPVKGRKPGGTHDVFVSYASRDSASALAVAKAVAARGWSVWIDQWRPLGGRPFRKQIEQALQEAGAVLVVWSKTSVTRSWVTAEASAGSDREVLVSARLDDAKPPPPFGEYEIRDLRGWDGQDSEHPGLIALMRDVAQVLNSPVPTELLPDPRVEIVRPLRALIPLAWAAVSLAMLTVWLVFRLGISPPAAFGALLFVAIFGFFARAIGAEKRMSLLVELVCGKPALVGLTAIVLGLWCFSAIVIQGPVAAGSYYPLVARVVLGAGPDAPARAKPLTAEARRLRWLVAVPPWGRTLRVWVEGHAPKDVRLFPWRGITLGLGVEITPQPILLVRVHRLHSNLADQAQFAVEFQGNPVARAVLTASQAAMLVGGQRSLEDRVPIWMKDLEGWEGRARQLCEAWGRAQPVPWGHPPSLDSVVRVVLTTHAGVRLTSKDFQLTGAFTDAEPALAEE